LTIGIGYIHKAGVKMIKVSKVLNTNGTGYWSLKSKPVRVNKLELSWVNSGGVFGELRVHFDTNTWDTQRDGLIYTDNLFMKELQEFLTTLGMQGSDVDYSEHGMQGDDYVSFDVGAKFISTYSTVKA
jgi:hypothetical protein